MGSETRRVECEEREMDRERVRGGEDKNGETIGEKHGDRSEPETRTCVEFVKSFFRERK